MFSAMDFISPAGVVDCPYTEKRASGLLAIPEIEECPESG
jgi:hypothetical protein